MCGCNKGKIQQPAVTNPNSILTRLRNAGRKPIQSHAASASASASASGNPWGNPLWKIMHILAFASSEMSSELASLWQRFFLSLQNELPCPVCRKHVQEWLKQNPDFLSVGIQQYILNLHNDVNSRRGVALWTLQQAETTYSVGGKEKQLSLVPLLMTSISMMPETTAAIQTLLASVS